MKRTQAIYSTKTLERLLKSAPFFCERNILTGASDQRVMIGWGFKRTSELARVQAKEQSMQYYAVEDAFIRSFDLHQKAPLPLGLVLDKSGIYYNAQQSSDLESWLNEVSQELSDEQLARARAAIELIKNNQLSKYNSIDIPLSELFDASTLESLTVNPAVLVIDQVRHDDSITWGMADEHSFKQMLDAALVENPNAQILIKVHPDTFTSPDKQGCIDLGAIENNPRVKIISERINPWSLFALVDRAYVVTSQMGFEALIAFNSQKGSEQIKKQVHCFGMPFYAGWGLTHDRLTYKRRQCKRTVEEIFYFAYMNYAHYINPFLKQRAELEDVCHIIADQKRHAEKYLYHHIAFGFSPWKKRFIRDFVQLSPIARLAFASNISAISQLVKRLQRSSFVDLLFFNINNLVLKALKRPRKHWPADDARFAKLPVRTLVWASSSLAEQLRDKHNKEHQSGEDSQSAANYSIAYMEDGFLRSVGLGADLARPYSLVVDSTGIYYDATAPSDLENLLENHDFFESDLRRAKLLRKSLLKLRLSKYNVSEASLEEISPSLKQKVILVPGQVEDDASIKKGCVDIKTNLSLLQAVRQANPQAFIVYKPHPDTLAAGRAGNSVQQKNQISSYCDHIAQGGSIVDWIERADEVHTMTSLAGFEALLRDKKVVTYGLPFYAGWGLTQDRHQCQRRTRKRSIDELVAAALIYYPIYVDPVTKQVCNVETIVQRLADSLEAPHKPSLKTQSIRFFQRLRNSNKIK